MIRISKIADYSISVLLAMAENPSKVYSATQLAQATHISASVVSKILKTLTKGKLLISARGSQGGYRLAQLPSELSIARVIALFDGEIGMTDCVRHEKECVVESNCLSKNRWASISADIQALLEKVSLDTMIALPPSSERPLVFHSKRLIR